MALRDRLKLARKMRGLTQAGLAALVEDGCTQSSIGNLEGRSGQRTSQYLPQIAAVLNVPILWLTDDDYKGRDPFAEIEYESADVVTLRDRHQHQDPHIAAVVELMEGLDARGRMECFAAVRAAVDRYQAEHPKKASGE